MDLPETLFRNITEGDKAVQEFIELVEDHFNFNFELKEKNNSKGHWYEMWHRRHKCIILCIEDHDGGAAERGLLTYPAACDITDFHREKLKWSEPYGKSQCRKKYDCRGKSYKEIYNMLKHLC